MVEKELVTKEKVENSGLFNFSSLYSYLYNWLDNKKYVVAEKEYIESVSGNARTVFFKWEAKRIISYYFKSEFEVEVTITNLVEVEVEVDGERKKMNKGRMVMEVKSIIVRDPEGKWDASPLYRFLRDIYNKYIIPGRVDNVKMDIAAEAIALKEDAKAFLEITGKR